MTIRFQHLSAQEIRKNHPSYYRDDITCFLIVKDQPLAGPVGVGLYGLIDRGVEEETGNRLGEGFLTLFPAFRFRVLSKGFLLALFDHADNSGFQKVCTWTRLPSWQKVFQRFESAGITRLQTSPPWDTDPTKIWFVKEKG